MIRLGVSKSADSPYNILCLGAHSDDIEIGCGGTVLKLQAEHSNCVFNWVVFSSDAQRAGEARESADVFLEQARAKTVTIHNFRNSFFPYAGAEIKTAFEQLKKQFSPDLILTHYRNDLHQDHRLISELTWNSFRSHLILEYEIPKYDGDLGSPNVFVHIDESVAQRKVRYILTAFQSQKDKHWFDEQTFTAMLRIRGVESCSKYAEAFYCRKMVLA